MNIATSTRKMTSARTAFSVMLRPHDELTEVDDTSATVDTGLLGEVDLHQLHRLGRVVADLHAPARLAGGRGERCTFAFVPSTPLSSRTVRTWSSTEVRCRHLPRDAALEVDAEVQPVEDERQDRDDDEHARHDDAAPAAAVEVDRRLAVVQPTPPTAA